MPWKAVFPVPQPSLAPNTYAYESVPLVKPTGFREYDACWLFEKELNLMGVQALGMAWVRSFTKWACGPTSSRAMIFEAIPLRSSSR